MEGIEKVFITKYALTSGIIECEMKVQISDTEKSCYGKPKDFQFNTGFYNNDFWLTKEEAIRHCEVMRNKKLSSIEKQKIKIQKIIF